MVSNGNIQHIACAAVVGVSEKLQEPAYLRPRTAMRELLTAYQYAKQVERDIWDFAVTIQGLRASGLTESDFRWLACEGIVQHAHEVTRLDDSGRQFRPTNPLVFTKRTCFVLTQRGCELARDLFEPDPLPQNHHTTSAVNVEQRSDPLKAPSASAPCRPCWEADRHELRLNGAIVKQFKWPAANQEIVLAAFQEEDWPFHIDDPLSPHPEQDSKRRLSDTIKCLNRKQRTPLIHFRGDGTGEGIIWEFVDGVQ